MVLEYARIVPKADRREGVEDETSPATDQERVQYFQSFGREDLLVASLKMMSDSSQMIVMVVNVRSLTTQHHKMM